MNYGWAGYGIYFALLQKLASTESRRLEFNRINEICFDLHCTKEELLPIIDNFFSKMDGMYFFSDELNEWLKYYDDKYTKLSDAGKKSQANKTPDQRSADAKKAVETRWNKAKETSGTTNTTDTKVSVSDTKVVSNMPVSDTENRIEQNRNEKEQELNRTEQNRTESKTFSSGLDLDSVSSYIENDHLLKSVYYGSTLNGKLVKEYLSSPSEIKNKLSYHQYEALYSYLLIFGYLKEIKDVNREYVIQLLNKDFDTTNSSIIRQLGTYVEPFIAKEPQFYKKLENFKL
jgi:hypothetical protein